jgi:putative membrane protein
MKNHSRKFVFVGVLALLASCQRRDQERAQQGRDVASPVTPGPDDNTRANNSAATGSAASNPTAASNSSAHTQTNAAGSASASASASGTALAVTEKLSDAQIAAITDGVNSSEIKEGELAKVKSKQDAVRSFANMMIEHHGEAKRKQADLKLATAQSTLSRQLEDQGKATLEQLRSKNGTEFDRAYLQAQIDGHQKVLDTINRDLIPQAEDDKLEAYLKELKPKVESHLEHAKMSLKALPATNGQTTPASGVRSP